MTEKEEIWLEAIKKICNSLEKNGCRYFLDTGTLLGAIRDGHFIPWDNDIDLSVVDCDNNAEVIPTICSTMYKEGYNVTATSDEIDVFDKTGLLNLGVKFYHKYDQTYWAVLSRVEGSEMAHSLYMSLSRGIIYKKGYSKYYLKSMLSSALRILSFITPKSVVNRLLYKADVKSNTIKIPANLLNDFIDYQFYDFTVKVPSDYKDYLRYRYGEDWNKPNPKYNYMSDDGAIKDKG